MAISSPEMMFVPVGRVSRMSCGHVSSLNHTKVDVTETTTSDLAADTVLITYAEVLHVVSGCCWCARLQGR